MKEKPSVEYLRECLHLDEQTGALTWKERPAHHFGSRRAFRTWNTRFAGQPFGGVKVRGRTSYLAGGVDGIKLYAHRIVWAMVHGKWPTQLIDHIDHNGLNNAPDNLREVNHSNNHRNRRLDPRNTSGHTGVSWDRVQGAWVVRIMAEGKYLFLGRFPDKCDAIQARQEAERRHGYHYNHGR